MRLFYANGGQRCLILSVGDYDDPVTFAALERGLERVADEVGPTMLLIPDALALSRKEHGRLARAMLEQAAASRWDVEVVDSNQGSRVYYPHKDTNMARFVVSHCPQGRYS